jgi:hypothetical protein
MLSTPEKRPLSSLADSPQDCQTLHALAFGYGTPLNGLDLYANGGRVIISSPARSLFLCPDGQVNAQIVAGSQEEPKPAFFNAYKVVTWLKQSNIEFGPNNPALV